jgi:hypothetical protein
MPNAAPIRAIRPDPAEHQHAEHATVQFAPDGACQRPSATACRSATMA